MGEMMTNSIYMGDNTAAFGNNFITINLNNPLNYPISKAVFVCNCLTKTFKNPVFPIVINFDSQETGQLRTSNTCYLVVYDSQGRQKTCKGNLTFKAQNGVINNGACC